MTASARPRFDAPYAADDGALVRRFIEETRLDPETEIRIDRRALGYIDAIRARSGVIGGLEDFLREFGLSTREGLALMVLAEALLRVPDADTQDRLIEEKLGGGHWQDHAGHGQTWFVAATSKVRKSRAESSEFAAMPGCCAKSVVLRIPSARGGSVGAWRRAVHSSSTRTR